MYGCTRTEVGGVEVVQLSDAARGIRVSIAPSIGNIAYEFLVNGKNMLWFPFGGPNELRDKPTLCGIPLLAPWANRIDGDTYWVNGQEYRLNPALGNLRRDPRGLPIHGLLLFSSLWSLVSADAGEEAASATSRLEFWKHPELMAQFPFAHEITVTHRLSGGSLEVIATLNNLSAQPLPVAIGYHPYFQLHESPRGEWRVHIAARDHLELDEHLIPTGRSQAVAAAEPQPLRDRKIDDVFAGLMRDSDGKARFRVTGGREEITVSYGPNYPIAIVYAPPEHEYICFEPMAAVTNAFNLAHEGKYAELPSIAPGAQWRESFWITVGQAMRHNVT